MTESTDPLNPWAAQEPPVPVSQPKPQPGPPVLPPADLPPAPGPRETWAQRRGDDLPLPQE